jgi:hypothetical protein
MEEDIKEREPVFIGENSIALKLQDALKNSGQKALERHALNGRPIVISVNGVIMNKYIDGRLEKREITP